MKQIKGGVIPFIKDGLTTTDILPQTAYAKLSQEPAEALLFDKFRYFPGLPKKPRPDFVMNQTTYQDASLLVLGDDIGAGKFVDETALAMKKYGFKAVIAGSFAEDFAAALAERGVLPVALPKEQRQGLAQETEPVVIDIEKLAIQTASGDCMLFALDEAWQRRFLTDMDTIDQTLALYGDKIAAFEASRPTYMK